MNDTASKRAVSALLMTLGILAGLYLTASLARATPPGTAEVPPMHRPGGAAGDGQRRGSPEHRREHPLLRTFDTNRDGELSTAEINAAAAVLNAYDSNGDGALGLEELMRALPPPQGMGHRGPPTGDGAPQR